MPAEPIRDAVPDEVIEFLDEQRTLTLATVSPNGVPHASTFLYVNEGGVLYFWSRAGTTTTRQIDHNPTVAFTVDAYREDVRRTRGLQGTGECEVVLSGETIARVADLFGRRFPSLRPGSTMSISFFRLVPTELQYIDNSGARVPGSEGTFGADFHRARTYTVFEELPVQPVEAITGALQRIEVQAGEVIVRAGGPADKFFVVVEGEVDVEGPTGEAMRLDPGMFFGEVAILRDATRDATLRARTAATLLAMDRDAFRDLLAQALGTTLDFDSVIRARLHPGG
jgi:uncharacterized protein YhbP (UPF0306 family)